MNEVVAANRAGAHMQGAQRSDRLLLLGIAIATLLLSLPTLWNLLLTWQYHEAYGHGYLMVLVAGWLVYGDRAKVIEAVRGLEPPRYGWLVVLAAATFQVVAYIGDFLFFAGVGVPLLIGAVAFAVGGRALIRSIGLPLVFLALMVPPGFLVRPLLVRLKLLVTELAVSSLQWFGDPVVAAGNQILIPGHELYVADACTGLTSIVTMLPIACLIAFASFPDWWRRGLLVASVIPVAISANVIRVVVTVKLVPILGVQAAQGQLHQGFGVAAFAVGILALFGFARLMR